jgi:bifunctional non-homologous end joining protein LigD
MSLVKYKKKRDFTQTSEPKGEKKKKGDAPLTFVIQRHDARRLHYDFRLELDGVLKSWAIPKGPSLDPADKRLAMMVEDHPLEYGKFSGSIPEGNYGAGTVDIWDYGTYTPDGVTKRADYEKHLREQFRKGDIKITLKGKKLQGSFALIHMKHAEDGNAWLLIKHRDDHVVKGYDIASVKPAKPHGKKEWTQADPEHPKEKASSKKKQPTPSALKSVRSGKAHKYKEFIEPMAAQTREEPFDDPGWVFEIKWDGYRAVAELGKKEKRLYSRNGLSFETLYPAVFNALDKIKEPAILDGEIVVLDENDRPSFQRLQQYGENPNFPIIYYVFDILSHKGKSLTSLPLSERKEILAKLLPKNHDVIRYSDHVEEHGKQVFQHAVELGVEGVIAKKADSLYNPGRRTYDWLKIKNLNTQEAVIAGYTAPRKSRKHLGALILGMYKRGKLIYIGHTGTGFTDKLLKEVYSVLQPLVRKTSPFEEKIPFNAPVTWVEPRLVCEVKFAELTDEGILRQAVFMGMRIDKAPKEVDHLDVEETDEKPAKGKKTPRTTKATKATTKPAPKKTVKVTKTARKKATEKDHDADDTGAKDRVMRVEGHDVKLTNQNKLYFPKDGITKGQVVEYYNSISKYILPYLKDRPESLKRNPNGIEDKGFYHKDAADDAPSYVDSITLPSDGGKKEIDYILCNNKATLLYMNNLGCIEVNPWNSRTKSLDNPDYLVLDLDPSDENTFNQVIDTALAVKEVLDRAGAVGYCKTSGASGLHIYVPLAAKYDYDQARMFAELVAHHTQELVPKFTTLDRPLNQRKGRLYIDYLQNKRGQTLASVYSMRPVPGATLSTPLEWKEVKHGLHPSDFTMETLPKRLAKKGDLFKPVLGKGIDMAKCLKKMEE